MTETWFIRAKDYPTSGVEGYGTDITIPIPTDKKVNWVRIKELSVPWNVFNITQYNDTMIIVAEPGTGSEDTSFIVIPHKYYDANTLASTIQSLANGTFVSPPATNVPFSTHTLSVGIDFLFMKTTLKVEDGTSTSVAFDITGPEGPKGPSVLRMLGYDGPGYDLTPLSTTSYAVNISGGPTWTIAIAGGPVLNLILPDTALNLTIKGVAAWLTNTFATVYGTDLYTFIATIDNAGYGCSCTMHKTSDGTSLSFTMSTSVVPSTGLDPFNLLGLATTTGAINKVSERPLYSILSKNYTGKTDFVSQGLLNIHHFRSIIVLCDEARGSNLQSNIPTWMDGIVDTYGIIGEVGDIISHKRNITSRWTKITVKKPFDALHFHLATDSAYSFGPTLIDWTFSLELR